MTVEDVVRILNTMRYGPNPEYHALKEDLTNVFLNKDKIKRINALLTEYNAKNIWFSNKKLEVLIEYDRFNEFNDRLAVIIDERLELNEKHGNA